MRINHKWSSCVKDPKKLWHLINWKGKIPEDNKKGLTYDVIYKFFTKIFQSTKTKGSPTLSKIEKEIEEYRLCHPTTDRNVSISELNHACVNMGSGISLDGLPPEITKVLPENLKEIIRHLFTNIFKGNYPKTWGNQLLFPITKKGHTKKDPKLRGIAIGPMLSRLYDHIMNERFCEWYTPNMQQAGYRKGQGCIFQLFALFLLIDNSSRNGKEVFIGLLDFEKAFDYTNRALLLQDMKNGMG